jgi:hypothetical protein
VSVRSYARRAAQARAPHLQGEEVWGAGLLGGGRDALAEAQPLLKQLARLARADACVQRPLRHLPLPNSPKALGLRELRQHGRGDTWGGRALARERGRFL